MYEFRDIMETVAQLMALSARTAPKTAGKDFLGIKIVKGEELKRVADDMVKYGEETGKKNFDRDGENILHSDAMLLISLNKPKSAGLNCGACGFNSCEELTKVRAEKEKKEGRLKGEKFKGPFCFWRAVDFGIAVGSAARTAGLHNADNRVMYRVGVSARRLGLISGEIVIGIPVSATGKNIYFDR